MDGVLDVHMLVEGDGAPPDRITYKVAEPIADGCFALRRSCALETSESYDATVSFFDEERGATRPRARAAVHLLPRAVVERRAVRTVLHARASRRGGYAIAPLSPPPSTGPDPHPERRPNTRPARRRREDPHLAACRPHLHPDHAPPRSRSRARARCPALQLKLDDQQHENHADRRRCGENAAP